MMKIGTSVKRKNIVDIVMRTTYHLPLILNKFRFSHFSAGGRGPNVDEPLLIRRGGGGLRALRIALWLIYRRVITSKAIK